jgi:hypothetical protein
LFHRLIEHIYRQDPAPGLVRSDKRAQEPGPPAGRARQALALEMIDEMTGPGGWACWSRSPWPVAPGR